MSRKRNVPKFDATKGREYFRGLVSLTGAVRVFVAQFDVEMCSPSSVERGRRIAALSNALEMANDMARRFALGITDEPAVTPTRETGEG